MIRYYLKIVAYNKIDGSLYTINIKFYRTWIHSMLDYMGAIDLSIQHPFLIIIPTRVKI